MPTIEEFGQKIKEKYPQYANVDAKELGTKFLAKHPEYQDRVFDTDPTAQANINPGKTNGILDAIKKGFTNIGDSIKSSGEAINPILDNSKLSFGGKVAGVTGKLLKPFAAIGAEAVATPLRVGGEVVENVTGMDVNEGTSKAIQGLVEKGLKTEQAQKVIQSYEKLKETNPEAANALSAAFDFADFATIGAGGAKAGMLGLKGIEKAGLKAGEKVVMPVMKGAGNVVAKTGNLAGSLAETATSLGTGMERSTIKEIMKAPEKFSGKAMEGVDRDGIFNRVKTSIDKRLEQLSETGKEYENIRKSGEQVVLKENPVKKILNKYGIDLDGKGKIVTSAESVPLGSGDIRDIENFVKQYGKSTTMSSNAFLNARKALSNMANYAEDKTDMAGKIAREMRKELDNAGKSSLTGLANLDAKFSSQIQLMQKVKKAIYNRDGSLKNNAVSVISNMSGKGKENLLANMEKIIPGIGKDLDVLKAIEDIDKAKGQKVGTYLRGAAGGFALSGGNPLAAMLSAIGTSPQVAVPVLRGVSKTKTASKEALSGMLKKLKISK